MKLNYNSISAKLYRSFYAKSYMPESLCPYFWKLFIAWPLTIIFTPLLIPYWIFIYLTKENDNETVFPLKVLSGVILYVLILGLFSTVITISSLWITYYEGSDLFGFYLIGWVYVLGASIALISLGVIKFKQYRKEKKWQRESDPNFIYEEDKPNIILEFIKSSYHKYCPKITWEKND